MWLNTPSHLYLKSTVLHSYTAFLYQISTWASLVAWECLTDWLLYTVSSVRLLGFTFVKGVCLKEQSWPTFSKMLDLYKNVGPCVSYDVDFIVFHSFWKLLLCNYFWLILILCDGVFNISWCKQEVMSFVPLPD